MVVRVDLACRKATSGGRFVQASAASLPFPGESFDVVIANHSFEHFDDLVPSILEMGRVLKKDGIALVTVPDARTMTDKIYRWTGKGGGHVNAFTTQNQLPDLIAQHTQIHCFATVVLHSGLSFMNRKNIGKNMGRMPRRMWLFGGGNEIVLLLSTYVCRWIDRILATRLSVYGWAYYLGDWGHCEPIHLTARTNVCIRCGSGSSAQQIRQTSLQHGLLYRCSGCGTYNLYTPDQS